MGSGKYVGMGIWLAEKTKDQRGMGCVSGGDKINSTRSSIWSFLLEGSEL
jgi:hypothetical protein